MDTMTNPNRFTSSSEVKEQGRAAYYKMLEEVREGNMVYVRRGVYATADQLAGTMIDLRRVVPDGILCLFSAWNIQHLTTSLPQAYHIAIKRGRKLTLPTHPPIELHYLTESLLEIGVEEKIVDGYNIRMYNAERCVCDAVKFRNKVGIDVCSEVVNNYLARPDRNLTRLMDYADRLRIRKILEKYLEIAL
jgi:hypothetical protein